VERPRSRPRGLRARLVGVALALIAVAAVVVAVSGAGVRAVSRGAADATPTPTPTPTATPGPTPTPLSTSPLTYVVVGASDAFGVGTDDPANDAWPTVVARRLSSDAHLINLGIPGATVDLALRDELPIALHTTPDLVTIWLGVNDFDAHLPPAEFARKLTTLINSLRSVTAGRIYVGNLPDLTLLPYFARQGSPTLREDVIAWNLDVERACAETGATLVDFFDGWSELAQHPEYISGDGLHPTTAGARRIADIFLTTIAEGQP
jgi:lysophospholipase L1-like esterase